MPYTTVLDALYDTVSTEITRADLYAFAGVVAANFASQGARPFDVSRFRVGRHDCSANGVENDADEEFPSNNMENVHQVHQFFENAFGLDLRESVALMGAHTLGRMRTANSGYEGPWVPGGRGPQRLDNEYYHQVVNVRWFLKVMPTNNQKHQWQRRAPSLGVGNREGAQNSNVLLNTDAALAVNLHLEENGSFKDGTECVMCARNRRAPGGGIPCCDRDSAGRDICSRYADNNEVFLEDFERAFYKMIDNPEDDLTLPTTVPTATTTAPQPPTRPPRSTRASRTRRRAGNGRGNGGGGGKKKKKGDEIMKHMDQVEKNIDKLLDDLKKVKNEMKNMT